MVRIYRAEFSHSLGHKPTIARGVELAMGREKSYFLITAAGD